MCFRILVFGSANSYAVRAAEKVKIAEGLEVIDSWKSGERIPLLVVVNATEEGEEVDDAIIKMIQIEEKLSSTAFRLPRIYVMAKSEKATQEAMRLERRFRGGRVERFDQRIDSAVMELQKMLRSSKRELAVDVKLDKARRHSVAV